MPPRVFEETVLPHLDAAFNYARWLTKNDVGGGGRRPGRLRAGGAVLLIACATTTRARGCSRSCATRGTAACRARAASDGAGVWTSDAGRTAGRRRSTRRSGCCSSTPSTACGAAIEQLPVDFREVIVLREIEGLSYKEIAAVVGVPIGTVMSRLARARERLLAVLKLERRWRRCGELRSSRARSRRLCRSRARRRLARQPSAIT